MPDSKPDRCSRCGAPRSAAAPAGLCPRCLMGNALDFDAEISDLCVAGEDGGVLETLAQTLGPMPRLLLTETRCDTAVSPLVRPSSVEMPPAADRSSRVQLLGEIARGGMGAILKGRDPALGRDLAVKVLLEAHRDKPDLVRRFVEEAQIGGQLQHPGIVPVYELGTFGDSRPYFTMKLVKGRTLAELLDERPRPIDDRPKLVAILLQVAQTIAYAHARGVIHRDLKPSNLMVGSFGEVQVMDWGLAKILPRGGIEDDARAGRDRPKGDTVIATNYPDIDPDGDDSRAGSVLGTPSYMAPEQARGEVDRFDERCDVFALGSILAEILTGQPAFSGRNGGEILRKSARGDLAGAFARLEQSESDPGLVGLARACLAAEPEDRPADAQEVADRLLGHLESVHQRLFDAELARAAEHARAEEAKRTASAEAARAEEARRAAESAEARARAERRARRLQVGLAASLAGLMALGGGGYALSQREKSERAGRTARAVEAALAESDQARSEARSAPLGELGKWHEAFSALNRAEAILAQGEADPSTRLRVSTWLARLEVERAQARSEAERIKADRDLLARLESIRGYRAVHNDLHRTSNEYVAAFRKAGLDLERLGPVVVRGWIASRSEPVELAGYLDDWASVSRRVTGTGGDDWRRMVAASRSADPDPWRDAIRARLGARDDASMAEFRRLADHVETLDAQPASSLVLLARELADLGEALDRERAARVLRRAATRHPADFWARFELGSLYGEHDTLLRREEAARHMTAATAIRPASSSAHDRLGRLLKLGQDQLDEAVNEFREAIRLEPARSWARIELYDILRGLGRLEVELASCREAVRHHPGDPWALANLAVALRAMGRNDEATARFRQAIDINSEVLLADIEVISAPSDDLGAARGLRGNLIGPASQDGVAILWDARAGAEALVPKESPAFDSTVSFSPDGSRIATASDDNAVWVWDTRTGDALLTIKGHSKRVRSVSFSPDGSRIVTASGDNAVRLWDARTGAQALTLKGHTDRVTSVSWSPDGSRIATSSNDETARVWDARSGAEALTLKGHAKQVWSVSFSPDGSRIATAGDDNAVSVWDARTGAEILTLNPGHTRVKIDPALSLHEASRVFTKADLGPGRPITLSATNNPPLKGQGRLNRAVAEYLEAIRLEPRSAPAYSDLGNALKAQGRLAEAEVMYRQALAIRTNSQGEGHSDNATSLNDLAVVLQDEGRLAEAEAIFRRALAIRSKALGEGHPDTASSYNDLAAVLRDQGRVDQAVDAYRRAIRLRPDDSAAHNGLGHALASQGKLDQAVAEYREAIRLEPDNALVYFNLGDALRTQGDHAGSLAMVRKGHELGSRQPGWRYPSAQWVADAEQILLKKAQGDRP